MNLALFDLDETLIGGDCSSLWSAFMVKQGWVADPDVFLQQDAEMMRLYAIGQMDMTEYMNWTLSPLKGRTEADVAAMVARFVNEVIADRVYAKARECLSDHQAKGDRTLIISASGEHLVAPIAKFLGVNETLAIGVEKINGVYTGFTEGVLTFREGKVTRLMALLNQDASQLERACFYSDSHNDLPLLIKVASPVAVNPDAILLQHARQAGWPVCAWR
ncbi:HAD family hydrolase [Rouxiella badensis]|uniref:HAD family hydrolase n=1 Tax=Rouxiella badensis TaxID=1646377 RepID=UPI00178878EA|nr:HAD family hydrolase [Rouxiella badensis]QOI57322.1 HAD family hydrolase [Rouxiella badensis subsp. acadiensis]WAT07983.1 HAD-IB family hydrolase [Rouxiella badensis]